MAKSTTPGKLKLIEQEYNEPLETLIPRLIQEEGAIYRAAARLGVAPFTLSNWLKNNRFRAVTRTSWERDN